MFMAVFVIYQNVLFWPSVDCKKSTKKMQIKHACNIEYLPVSILFRAFQWPEK